jgi:threonyl-tRNA synthetase
MIVLGDREVCDDEITVRTQKGEDLGNMKMDVFMKKVANEIRN